MFFIDKYKINNINDIIYHKDIYKNLLKIENIYDINKLLSKNILNNKYKNIPNILFYGPYHSGKQSLINIFIKHIFNVKTLSIKKVKYNISGYGNNNVEVILNNSMYHIEINPYGTGFDKYLIQEVIKNYIKTKFITLNNENIYKMIVIKNIDKLSYYAQTSLRCTMEKYSNNCKFILCGYNISKIIEPIKSRCLFIKVKRPSKLEVLNYILYICYKEDIKISKEQLKDFLDNYNCNICKILWKLNYLNIDLKSNIELEVNNIINLLDKDNTINNIKTIREKLYFLFITNLNFKKLLKYLLLRFMKIIDNEDVLFQILKEINKADLNLSLGKRVVIHFENLLYHIMYIFKINNYKIKKL